MHENIGCYDVDQTVAGGVVQAHMSLYNEKLDLGMSDEEVERTNIYPTTFAVPQIEAFRSQERGEERFQAVRAEIRTSDTVHLAMNSLPGSVEGIRQLLNTVTHGGWYTVRPPEIKQTTQTWLQKENFPNPDGIVICTSHQDKIIKVVEDHLLNRPDTMVLLIDDQIDKLAKAAIADDVPANIKEQYNRLILVGFGQTRAQLEGAFYPQTGLRTLALPNWDLKNVEKLQEEIQSLSL